MSVGDVTPTGGPSSREMRLVLVASAESKKRPPKRAPIVPSGEREPRCYGMITESITWMTPLDVSMSVCTTFAPSIMTVSPSTLMSTVEP